MHRHPDRQWVDLSPVLSQQGLLPSHSCGHRLGSGREGGLHRIPDGLVVDAPMGINRCVEESDMALDGDGHRSRVPLPERGTSLDIGEEERDGAAGKIGHDLFQILSWTWCLPIVARGHEDQAEARQIIMRVIPVEGTGRTGCVAFHGG
jgi:hypothetical protein